MADGWQAAKLNVTRVKRSNCVAAGLARSIVAPGVRGPSLSSKLPLTFPSLGWNALTLFGGGDARREDADKGGELMIEIRARMTRKQSSMKQIKDIQGRRWDHLECSLAFVVVLGMPSNRCMNLAARTSTNSEL
jgi:hypothetical protein